ncbi:MAG: methylmalonyl Co-A mutase-associated GTPase MeaB [Anaerolineae bacterium]|nr:methylmalonyl Co-A mutase-associated GTPase MeaB [Anaerolineae bacterium]
MELVAQVLGGDRRALARLISRVENRQNAAHAVLSALYPHTGRAHVVGVTGPPGTGKSTLVNEMAKALRARKRTVGVVAVDPTSPFSGGALLGDRVRMRDLAGDPGVFIRSMATRGSLGGLAKTTSDVVKVLDAAGFEIVLVETVGVGQAEVDVARTAHTTIVIEAPGLGDEVQAMKAGLMEIADILVVNKADRPGAANTARALEITLELGRSHRKEERLWEPPILKTVALTGMGVDKVLDAVADHYGYLQQSDQWTRRERERARSDLLRMLEQELVCQLVERAGEKRIEAWVERIAAREADVYTAVRELIAAK